ncbi:MAG: AMP-binding protein, partial [Vulcanimicrobiaceae bacterium]
MRRSAARTPDASALRFGERHWTFAELDRGANRLARAFVDAGLAPGERLAAYARNSDGYVLAWLACLRAGVIHVPINYALRPDELGYIVRQSGAAALLHDDALTANVEASPDAGAVRPRGRFAGAGDDFDVLALAQDERADASA